MKFKSGETPSGPLCDFCGDPVHADGTSNAKVIIECTRMGLESNIADEADCCPLCWLTRVSPALVKLLKPGHSFNRYRMDGSDFLDDACLDPTVS